MTKTRVGVLRGGPSDEYDVSLKTGRTVLDTLPPERFLPKEIFIDKQGTWHVRGRPVEPARALSDVDVVFNGLHGTYGEDGTVQRILDVHGVPYTGSGVLASALGMHKVLAKEQVRNRNITLAQHVVVDRSDVDETYLVHLFRSFPQPSVIKPLRGGSSVGVVVSFSWADFVRGITAVLAEADQVLVEEYIQGREATVGVINGFRGEEMYALPPIEIIPRKSRFFDYDEKYAGHAEERCPSSFPYEVTQELIRMARDVHTGLGLRHYSRSDFIVSRRGIFFLEVNTLPGLTEASLVPRALRAVGSSLEEFLPHVIGLAISGK